MQEFKATHPVELIEALMTHVGYATRTRARNALKRGEVLVNGQVCPVGRMSSNLGTGVHPVERGDGQTQPNGRSSIQGQQNQRISSTSQGTVSGGL